MKQISNVQRAQNYLVKIFRFVNEEYFDNSLEEPAITIQSTSRSYGHVSVGKVWNNDTDQMRELNISADYLNTRPIENVVSTMIHESVHIYCMQNGIKDTSRGGRYHNRRFKEEAEKRGLIIEHDPVIGYSITEPSEETIDFCIRYGLEDIKIGRATTDIAWIGIGGNKAGNGTSVKPPRKPSSTRKYICYGCMRSFRATSNLDGLVRCEACGQLYERAD